VAAWPGWDPHEEKARLDGPCAPAFRLIWEKGVRAGMRLAFTALAAGARGREQARA